jgi:hypothetical protein
VSDQGDFFDEEFVRGTARGSVTMSLSTHCLNASVRVCRLRIKDLFFHPAKRFFDDWSDLLGGAVVAESVAAMTTPG